MTDLRTDISKTDKQNLQKHLAGWNTLYPFMMQLSLDEKALITLRKLLTLELSGQCRQQIVMRLVGRIRNLRQRLEEQFLFKIMGDRIVTPSPRAKKIKGDAKQAELTVGVGE